MGTALMHFLSDSNQTFQDLGLKEYPMAFMLCSLGYILTMLDDFVLLWVNQKNSVGKLQRKEKYLEVGTRKLVKLSFGGENN